MMCSLYITLSTTKLLDLMKIVTVIRVKMTKMF